MDSKVDISSKKRAVDSVGEVRRTSRGEVTVATRLDRHELELEIRRYPGESGPNKVGLRAGETTPASADPDKIGHAPAHSERTNRSTNRQGRASSRGYERDRMSPTL
jgi:hypothetical protein